MNHRRDHHPTNKQCRFYQVKSCRFTSNECWYKHNKSDSNDNFKCITCKDEFNSLNSLLTHKTREHPETCTPCKKLSFGGCPFNEKTCWNAHDNSAVIVNTESLGSIKNWLSDNDKDSNVEDFHKAQNLQKKPNHFQNQKIIF